MPNKQNVRQATPKPCAQCPWRISNQGKRHPGGWYTRRNLERLWAGMRRGEDMTCHPTDPDNPVTEAMALRGVKRAPEAATTVECAGSLILKQREFMRAQDALKAHGNIAGGMAAYRKAHPRGLTKRGFIKLVQRMMFGGSPLAPGPTMSTPNLNDPDVGVPFLEPWAPQ